MTKLFKKFFMKDNDVYYVFGIAFSLLFLIALFIFSIKLAIFSFVLMKISSLIIVAYFMKQMIKTIDADHSYEINRTADNIFGVVLFSNTFLTTYFIYVLVNFIDANIEASKDYLSIKVKDMIHKKEEPKDKETYRD